MQQWMGKERTLELQFSVDVEKKDMDTRKCKLSAHIRFESALLSIIVQLINLIVSVCGLLLFPSFCPYRSLFPKVSFLPTSSTFCHSTGHRTLADHKRVPTSNEIKGMGDAAR